MNIGPWVQEYFWKPLLNSVYCCNVKLYYTSSKIHLELCFVVRRVHLSVCFQERRERSSRLLTAKGVNWATCMVCKSIINNEAYIGILERHMLSSSQCLFPCREYFSRTIPGHILHMQQQRGMAKCVHAVQICLLLKMYVPSRRGDQKKVLSSWSLVLS